MIPRFLVLGTTLLASTLLAAGNSAPEPSSVVFSGRWDLRTPGRAITVNSGSYLRARFSGATLTANFDLTVNEPPFPTIAWRIDDGEWQEAEIADKVKLAEGLTGAGHSVWLMVRGIDEHQNRWTAPLIGSVTFAGLELSEGGALLRPLETWMKPALKMEFLGDSITEGVLVQAGGRGAGKTAWPWQTDALHSYAARTAQLLQADWRQVGFGATGLSHSGSGHAPGALKTFNYFYDGCPRDDWQPDVVVINQGTNDRGATPEVYAPLYAQYLKLVRAAYPKARIVALRPFVGAQADSISQEVAKARAAGDQAIYYIDTTGWHTGALHPGSVASAGIADKLAAALKIQVIGQ